MSFAKVVRTAAGLAAAVMMGCATPTDPTAADVNGTYVLESASGRGPASGMLILTRQGYAERRVRFREPNGGLSKEYLARGSVTVNPDNTIALELREMDLMTDLPWTPNARLTESGIEITHPDAGDGPPIVEQYRRK
jgi:hypothetical protein